ncbi:MAG: hypothetical protein ABSF22_12515 [Bryobacteraceae bacterium]
MSRVRTTAFIFLSVSIYLGWISASRVFLSDNDEGIYLSAALRILHGQMPYKDFFTLCGPGSFFLMAASFRIFGITLATARIPAIFDLALLTSCVCWLTWKLAGRAAALSAALAFVSFETLWHGVLANHRWDSSAWMTLAATLVFFALDQLDESPPDLRKSAIACAAAGVAATVAVFCTPPVAFAGAALGACLLFAGKKPAAAFLGGVTVASALGAGLLASRGAFGPMIHSMKWAIDNYGIANHTYYGWVIGGYGYLFHALSVGEAAVTLLVLIFITLPATLPILSAMWLWKRPPLKVIALLASSAALVVSSYPRWDLIHLNFVAALFYVLAATLIWNSRFRKIVAITALVAAASCLGITAHERLFERSQMTMLGSAHGPTADLQTVAMLQQQVRPSDTLFVFPYRPIVYFLTQARNPTRYSFLQPGMFPESDASQALADLRKEPPRWVVYMDIPDSEFLRIWPGSDPARMRMPGIESFIHERYKKIDQSSGFQLLELK